MLTIEQYHCSSALIRAKAFIPHFPIFSHHCARYKEWECRVSHTILGGGGGGGVGKMMCVKPYLLVGVGVCSPGKFLKFTCSEVASGAPKSLEMEISC